MKRILAWALLIILVFSLSGCDSVFKLGEDEESSAPEQEDFVPARQPEYPVSAFDISLDSRPQSVVSLSPSITDKLFEMGFGERIAGISDDCENGDGESRTRCGSPQMPDMEAIEDLNPHILFTDAALSQASLDKMGSLGIKIALVENASNLNELKSIYVALAQLMDGIKTGETAGQIYFEQVFEPRISELSEKAQDPKRNGIYVRTLDYNVATGDTLEGELLGIIGLVNVAEDFAEWNIPEEEANAEEAREKFRAIDFIYMDRDDITIKDMEQSAFWRGLNAVLKDYYLYIDSSLFERQSIKMLDELDRMQQYANGEIPSSKEVDYPPQAAPAPAPAPAQNPAPAPEPAPEPKPEPEPEPNPDELAPEEGDPDDLGDEELGDGGDEDFDDEDFGDDYYDDDPDNLEDPDELDA